MPGRDKLKRPSTCLSDAKMPRHWQQSLPALADAARPNRYAAGVLALRWKSDTHTASAISGKSLELLRVLTLRSPCINRRIVWGA
jgi:hypothetical protein